MILELEYLYQVEESVELASRNVLSASVATLSGRRTGSVASTPAVNVRFTQGDQTGHMVVLNDTNNNAVTTRYDSWNGTLVADVVTERSTNNSYHGTYVSNVRNYLCERYNYYMPYHNVEWVTYGGTSMMVDEERNEDITSLTFNLLVSVRPEAWTSVTSSATPGGVINPALLPGWYQYSTLTDALAAVVTANRATMILNGIVAYGDFFGVYVFEHNSSQIDSGAPNYYVISTVNGEGKWIRQL